MRTTLDLPIELIKSAMKVTECKTKTELITFALNDLVRKKELEKLVNFHGKVNLDIDISNLRKR